MKTPEKHMESLMELVVGFLRDDPVKVVLFGSRARGDHRLASDADIGLIPRGPIRPGRIALLRDMIEQSNIPLRVEIVDLSASPQSLRDSALKDAIPWKD